MLHWKNASLGHWQATFGSDDDDTLARAVEVGLALRRLGRWEEATELNLDTLRRLRLLFGITDKVYILCAASCGIDLRFAMSRQGVEK